MLPQTSDCSDQRMLFSFLTRNSGMALSCGVDHALDTICAFTVNATLVGRAARTLDRVRKHGFDQLVKDQRAYLDDFWARSDIQGRPNASPGAAVHSLEPLSAPAGSRPGRLCRGAGQGADRSDLRWALLLGPGDVHSPVPDLHGAALGQEPAALSLQHPRQGAGPGSRTEPERRPIRLAHPLRGSFRNGGTRTSDRAHRGVAHR